MNTKTLSNVTLNDMKGAKANNSFAEQILPAGKHIGKFLGATEEDTYSYFKFEIGGQTYRLFFNLTLKGSDTIDLNTITWIKGLAVITVDDNTKLSEIINTAIGNSYEINIYNYVAKTGKNAGKNQHAIDFKTAPVLQATSVVTEKIDLPF